MASTLALILSLSLFSSPDDLDQFVASISSSGKIEKRVSAAVLRIYRMGLASVEYERDESVKMDASIRAHAHWNEVGKDGVTDSPWQWDCAAYRTVSSRRQS